jgi:hypothetical protein
MNTLRKIVLLTINVFIEVSIYKALFCAGFLILMYFIQLRLKPYRETFFNSLEQKEMVASLGFILAGILFLQTDISPYLSWIIVIILTMVNISFFAFFLQILGRRYESKFTILNIFPVILQYFSCYKFSQEEML